MKTILSKGWINNTNTIKNKNLKNYIRRILQETDPTVKKDRRYCIRSKIELVDKNNLKTEIIGYDVDYDIIPRTQKVCCEMCEHSDTHSLPKVIIESYSELCDGTIYVRHPNGTTTIKDKI